ncbi:MULTISPECIES: hypothetical protein [Stutzerimonas stutzeri subgroup]|uniref:hypothetical protein n=1 Tax=Stutzerimonas stutzeri subgroup TaxID=578833 RepID=UPI0028AD6991|nr:hypothetical protein [Stutzerimonas kunmingensis]
MSVENQRHRINIARMAEWLGKRGVNQCPFCKKEQWEAVNGSTFVGSAIPFGDGEGDMYMAGLPVLLLTCMNCYFVRPISLKKDLLDLVLEKDDSPSIEQ